MIYIDYNDSRIELNLPAQCNPRLTSVMKVSPNGSEQVISSYSNVISVVSTERTRPNKKNNLKPSKQDYLKITSMDRLKAWNGSLLNISFSCKRKDHHVFLKMKSLPPFPELLLPSTEETTVSSKEETSTSGGINATAIALPITLLLVAVLLGLVLLVCYRRRKRARVQEDNYDLDNSNHFKGIYEDPDRSYETLSEGGNNISVTIQTDTSGLNESTKPAANGLQNKVLVEQPEKTHDANFYNYPDISTMTMPLSAEHEYTYAQDIDQPRGNLSTKVTGQDPENDAMYNTLEDPEQMTDDFYHYPDNVGKPSTVNLYKDPGTNIPTELEYVYAKDTDQSTTNLITGTPNHDPVNKAIYHTLENPEQTTVNSSHNPDNTEKPSTVDLYKEPSTNIPIELEYTYAKDTEIPRTCTKAANDAVYHTLEQEERTSTDQEHSYAKNNDIPSLPSAVHSSFSPHSDSLNESDPPQAAVCSTIDKSA